MLSSVLTWLKVHAKVMQEIEAKESSTCFTLKSMVMHQSALQKRSKSISALQFVVFQLLNTDMDTQSCKSHVCKKQAISE